MTLPLRKFSGEPLSLDLAMHVVFQFHNGAETEAAARTPTSTSQSNAKPHYHHS
jgi:hypothetical protein